MTDLNQDLAIAQIIALMTSYSFDTDLSSAEELVQEWLQKYHVNWIYLATIEALYLGRYKAISIEQIMNVWLRIGQPSTHFGGDFERVICRKLPRHLTTSNPVNELEKLSIEDNDTNIIAEPNSDRQKAPHQDSQFTNSASATPIISTHVTPLPKQKSPLIKKISSPKSIDSHPDSTFCQDRGIVTFQPLPDASGFFQKLKDLAKNQRQEK